MFVSRKTPPPPTMNSVVVASISRGHTRPAVVALISSRSMLRLVIAPSEVTGTS